MSPLESIKASLDPELTRLNELIHEQLSTDNPLMTDIIEGYLRSKGKQIRPLVVMLSARLFGQIDDKVLSAAAAVELLHNASLIHDDVVDESKLRRGIPTINALWDNHIAVLIGDYFVSAALHRAIATADMDIVSTVGRLGTLLSLGEIDQIYNTREHELSEEAYYRIINFKTASLFVACARVGCYATGAPARQADTLAEVAELLGLCFQIRDDVFDYFPADKVGKPTGNDLREGKVTLPLLHALEVAPDPARPRPRPGGAAPALRPRGRRHRICIRQHGAPARPRPRPDGHSPPRPGGRQHRTTLRLYNFQRLLR